MVHLFSGLSRQGDVVENGSALRSRTPFTIIGHGLAVGIPQLKDEFDHC